MQLGAAINLFDTDAQSARTHITTAEKLANQAQRELTGLIQELRPAALEGQGLSEAVRKYLHDWSNHTGIQTNFRLQNEQPVAPCYGTAFVSGLARGISQCRST